MLEYSLCCCGEVCWFIGWDSFVERELGVVVIHWRKVAPDCQILIVVIKNLKKAFKSNFEK